VTSSGNHSECAQNSTINKRNDVCSYSNEADGRRAHQALPAEWAAVQQQPCYGCCANLCASIQQLLRKACVRYDTWPQRTPVASHEQLHINPHALACSSPAAKHRQWQRHCLWMQPQHVQLFQQNELANVQVGVASLRTARAQRSSSALTSPQPCPRPPPARADPNCANSLCFT
jgi:hypothetical protein